MLPSSSGFWADVEGPAAYAAASSASLSTLRRCPGSLGCQHVRRRCVMVREVRQDVRLVSGAIESVGGGGTRAAARAAHHRPGRRPTDGPLRGRREHYPILEHRRLSCFRGKPVFRHRFSTNTILPHEAGSMQRILPLVQSGCPPARTQHGMRARLQGRASQHDQSGLLQDEVSIISRLFHRYHV